MLILACGNGHPGPPCGPEGVNYATSMPAESQPSGAIVRFGVFELNLAAGQLTRDGAKLRLQEQPFQVLALLLERAGEVVTRDELRQKLWPADTFVDFDHSRTLTWKFPSRTEG